jgi:hypothetical protein
VAIAIEHSYNKRIGVSTLFYFFLGTSLPGYLVLAIPLPR